MRSRGEVMERQWKGEETVFYIESAANWDLGWGKSLDLECGCG